MIKTSLDMVDTSEGSLGVLTGTPGYHWKTGTDSWQKDEDQPAFPSQDVRFTGSCYLKGHRGRLGSCSLVALPANSPAWVIGRSDEAAG